MKRFFLIIAVIFLYSQVFSQGKLTFFSQDGKKFWVIINGEKMNKEAQYNVKDIPVTFQWGKVRIIFEDENIKPIDKNVQVVDVDNNWTHTKYMIKYKKGKYVINDFEASYEVLGPVSGQQNNTVTPTQTSTQQQNTQTQPQTQTQTQPQNTNVSQTTNLTPTTITTTVTDPLTGQTITTGVNLQISQSAQTVNQSSTVSSQTTNQQTGTITQTPANSQQPANYVMPGYNGKIGCPWPMKDNDFFDAKNSISSKSFEDSKMTVAKQITGANCLLCSQVKEIMLLFNFEDSRLDFAKYAYDYVYDKNNYYKLNDAFSFESTIEELNQYISTKK